MSVAADTFALNPLLVLPGGNNDKGNIIHYRHRALCPKLRVFSLQ